MLQNDEYRENSDELSLEDILFMFKRRFWWFFAVVIITVVVTIGYVMVITPIYESSVTIKVEPSSKSTSIEDIFTTGSVGSARDIETEIELIKSRTNLEKVVDNLKLMDILIDKDNKNIDNKSEQYKRDLMVKKLSGMISVSPVKNTKIVEITVENAVPDIAAKIANELAVVYNEQLADMSKKDLNAKKEFLEMQLPIAGKELDEAISDIRMFKEESNVFELSQEAKYVLEVLTDYDKRISETRLSIQQNQIAINTLKEKLDNTNAKLVQSEVISLNPLVSELRSKLTNLNIELATMDKMYPSSDPRIIQKKKQIEETQKELSQQVTNIVTSQQKVDNPIYSSLLADLVNNEVTIQLSQSILEALAEARKSYDLRLSNLPSLEQKLLELNRDLEIKQEIYTLLFKNLEEVKIAQAAVVGNSYIVDTAIVPLNPVKPNKKLTVAIGGVLGVFLGILLVFMIEFLDKTVRSEEELERVSHKKVPVLGRIPNLELKQGNELVTKIDMTSPETEALKLAANNILYSSTERLKILTITSAGPSEGKTTFAANFAQILSQNGEKVVVVDFDMRKPRLEKVFNLQSIRNGIVNYFTSDIPIELITISIDDNLDIIPVGPIPPNPTSLLSTRKLDVLFDRLCDRYDRIIIDTPPIMAAADVTLFASKTDGVILITLLNKTIKPSLKIAMTNLNNTKAKILGFIVNGISEKNSNYYYYYYYKDGKKSTKRKKPESKKKLINIK